MEYDAELHIGNVSNLIFSLEEFWIDGVRLNFHFKGGDGTSYDPCDSLVYVTHDEIELVKNFLITLRG